MPRSFALLGGFAIGARVALLYGNITRTRNVSKYMLVLAVCLVVNVCRYRSVQLTRWYRGWTLMAGY